MTDAVTKKLKVEVEVSQALETDHVLIHILCKSHTCEKLDESCVNALIQVEQQLKMADLIVTRHPRLKSFVRQTNALLYVQ